MLEKWYIEICFASNFCGNMSLPLIRFLFSKERKGHTSQFIYTWNWSCKQRMVKGSLPVFPTRESRMLLVCLSTAPQFNFLEEALPFANNEFMSCLLKLQSVSCAGLEAMEVLTWNGMKKIQGSLEKLISEQQWMTFSICQDPRQAVKYEITQF